MSPSAPITFRARRHFRRLRKRRRQCERIVCHNCFNLGRFPSRLVDERRRSGIFSLLASAFDGVFADASVTWFAAEFTGCTATAGRGGRYLTAVASGFSPRAAELDVQDRDQHDGKNPNQDRLPARQPFFR